jgi:hypothetical protein
MIFSKNIKSDFAFDFGGVSIAPVDTHKDLGITFRTPEPNYIICYVIDIY